jgi:hypothetical protein
MDGGVRRGYCDIGSHVMDITPAIVSTMEITIAKRGRSTKMRENVFILSIDSLIPSFILSSSENFRVL